MTRWKAAGLHLIISFFVVGLVAACIIYFWYPPALIHMAKADRLLMLIGGIDLIVGPLLTLIIYKTGKPKLKLDLAVIGLIQLSFLSYGLYTVWNSRPIYLVAVKDRFELVFVNEIAPERLADAKNAELIKPGFAKPKLVGAAMPSDYKEQEKILFSAAEGRGDIQTMPKYFVEYSSVAKDLMKHAKPLVAGKNLSSANAKALQEAAHSYGYKPDELRYVTLSSTRGFASMLVKANTGEVVGPANVDP